MNDSTIPQNLIHKFFFTFRIKTFRNTHPCIRLCYASTRILFRTQRLDKFIFRPVDSERAVCKAGFYFQQTGNTPLGPCYTSHLVTYAFLPVRCDKYRLLAKKKSIRLIFHDIIFLSPTRLCFEPRLILCNVFRIKMIT